MKVIVEITWDFPEEKEWLCPDNIKLALGEKCKNTKFEVKEVKESQLLDSVNGMCEESLDPEAFEEWCKIENKLKNVRSQFSDPA